MYIRQTLISFFLNPSKLATNLKDESTWFTIN